MKKWNFFFVGLLVLVFCSCEGLFYNPSSKVVKFRASAGDDVRTRTAYTNYIDPVTGKERIEWETGDPVMIYMYWKSPEGSTETNNPVHEALYTVSFNHHISNERSYGELTASELNNSPLMWKGDDTHVYTHYFYSIYPAGKGFFYTSTDDGSNPSIEFSLPANQDGRIEHMQYAYMAAAAPAVTTKYNDNYSTTIDLDYYPMVTTIYVDITNNSSRAISEVILTSTDEDVPLVGDYTVNFTSRQIGSRPFGTNLGESSGDKASNANRTVTIPIPSEITSNSSKKIAFFVRPRTYENNLDLKFKWGEETKSVGSLGTVTPFSKYNIKVTINKNDDIEITQNGDAQLLFGLLFMMNEGDWGTPPLSSFLGVDDINYINNNFRNKAITIEDYNALNEKYPNLFQQIFNSVTHLKVDRNIGVPITDDIGPAIFKLFRNLTDITILVDSTPNGKDDGKDYINIDVDGLSSLTSITLSGNTAVHLTVTKCNNLVTATKNNNSNTTITVDGKNW